MEYKVVSNISDVWKVEEIEKTKFIYSTLEILGVPLANIWSYNHWELSTDEREKLRNFLRKYSIDIIHLETTVEIMVEKETVAIWEKPAKILKKNNKSNSPKNFYIEMTIKYTLSFEKEA